MKQNFFSCLPPLSVCLQAPDEVFGAIAQEVSGCVFVSDWVGAGGLFFLLSWAGGVASIPCWMVKSAVQQKSIPRWGLGMGGKAASAP